MAISSPRLRRLDSALLDLSAESEAMLLSELDGYPTGVIVCPEPIEPGEWLPRIWGVEDQESPFEDAREAQWYADLVMGHHDAILLALGKGAGRYAPFLEVDVRNDEVLWELWIEGFATAMDLRPDAWTALADSSDADVLEAFGGLVTLVEIARDESSLDRPTIDALTDEAPGLIPTWVELLHAQRIGSSISRAARGPTGPEKTGRNDPCPCGSGRKHKKCCGLN